MANDIRACVYTDDLGNNFIIGLDGEIFAQTTGDPAVPKVGGRARVLADKFPAFPRNYRPRKVRMESAAGKTRYVICLTNDAPLWADPAVVALNIEDSDGVASAYEKTGTLGEKFRRRRVG